MAYFHDHAKRQRSLERELSVDINFLREDDEEHFSSVWIWGSEKRTELARHELQRVFGLMRRYPIEERESIPDELHSYLQGRPEVAFKDFARSTVAARFRARLLAMGVDGSLAELVKRYCGDFVELDSGSVRLIRRAAPPLPAPKRQRTAEGFLDRMAYALMPPIRAFGVEIGPQIL